MEYERLEPFGSWRDNWHASLIATSILNVFRGKNQPPFSMSEFFYKDEETAKEDKRKSLFAVLGGLGKGKHGRSRKVHRSA